MPKWVLVVASLVLAAGSVFAQAATPALGPISTLEAGDFRALATTVDGDRLLVADAPNMQVRIYDFTDPANPALLSSLDVSGTPVLIAGGEDYGLIAVTTDGTTDTLEVVAPPLPGSDTPYASGYNYIDIDKNPRSLALSPDNHWGIVVSEHGYTLLQINSPSDVGSLEVSSTLIDAALSNSTAYLLQDQSLETATLGSLEAMSAEKTLALGGTPSLVTLNGDASSGAVVVDDTRIVLFDPATLQQTGTFSISGQPITGVHFLSKDASTQYLLVTQQNSSTITMLNVSDPKSVTALANTPSLGQPIRALTVFQHYVIASDGVTISIFTL